MAPVNWNQRVWRLAGPIMLSNVSVPLLGAVDTAVVGQLPGPYPIGGVAVGAMIFSLVYWGFGFLRMGTTGFTAQSLGAGDDDEVRAYLLRSLTLALILGVAVMAMQKPLAWGAFAIVSASDQVQGLADTYFSIRIWGAPAALANYAFLGWFIGIQNTRAALILQLVMNGANIVLDLWFVMGLDWGVAGVAWATLISETGAAALGAWLAIRNARALGGAWRLDRILDSSRLKRMVAVNGDLFVRTLCLEVAFVTVTAIGARLGDVTLAANAVLMHFQTIMAYGLDGFAHSVETLAGSALGARDRTGFRAAVTATTRWALLFALAFTVAYGVAGPMVIDLLSTEPEVRDTARTYLPWIVALPLISVWSFQLDGIFIGTTHTAEMRNAMIVSLAVFAGGLMVCLPWLGNHGLWLALTIFMAVRGITLGIYYPRIERSINAS